MNSIDERWLKWDKMYNDGQYIEIIKEFDQMLKNKEKIVIGDLLRRDHALQEVNITPISKSSISLRKNNVKLS